MLATPHSQPSCVNRPVSSIDVLLFSSALVCCDKIEYPHQRYEDTRDTQISFDDASRLALGIDEVTRHKGIHVATACFVSCEAENGFDELRSHRNTHQIDCSSTAACARLICYFCENGHRIESNVEQREQIDLARCLFLVRFLANFLADKFHISQFLPYFWFVSILEGTQVET